MSRCQVAAALYRCIRKEVTVKMSYNLSQNTSPVQVTAAYDSAGAINLLYGAVDLSNHSDEVGVELGTGYSTHVRVADFTHSGTTRNVYVFEADASGGLSGPWTRSGGEAISGSTSASATPKDVDMVVMAVPSGDPAPSPANLAAAQGSGAGVIRVKIRPIGGLPGGSSRRDP